MALGLDRTQLQFKKTGVTITVPSNPYGKMMYYFDCVCNCIEIDSDSTVRRLRDYNNYSSLSTQEELMLLKICIEAASPDKLIGQCFFPNEDLDGCSNEFFELTAVKTKLVVSDSFLVGGQQKKIHKIMMFKKSWLENHYFAPLRSITSSLRTRPAPRLIERSDCVVS